MKMNSLWPWHGADDGELLASFGDAQLVKHLDGTCEIQGGSAEERGEARDWVSLFLQHVILREPQRVKIVGVAQPGWRMPDVSSQRAGGN
jgi:hypothetical protein